MKKFITILLTIILLLSLTSCGETVVCEMCEKEVKEYQIKTREFDDGTRSLCKECDNYIQDYLDGKIVECWNCNKKIYKDEAHKVNMFGETMYTCSDCFAKLK